MPSDGEGTRLWSAEQTPRQENISSSAPGTPRRSRVSAVPTLRIPGSRGAYGPPSYGFALEIAAQELENGPRHPKGFTTANRWSRLHDVSRANSRAALSCYEADPGELGRHANILGILSQAEHQAMVQGDEARQLRHLLWAAHQRELFRQQRQERASRYVRSGLPLRHTYTTAAALGKEAGAARGVAGGATRGSDALEPRRPWSGDSCLPGGGGRCAPAPSTAMAAAAWGKCSAAGAGAPDNARVSSSSRSSSSRQCPACACMSGSCAHLAQESPLRGLPQPTFFKVFDAGLRLRDEQRTVEKQSGAEQRAKEVEVGDTVAELDSFEWRLRLLERQRACTGRGGR